MIRKIWIINLILSVVIIWAVGRTYDLWTEKSGEERIARNAVASNSEKMEVRNWFSKRRFIEANYENIPAHNMFSPERKPYKSEKPAEKNQEVKPVRKSGHSITLFGVILIGDDKKAMINNPERLNKGDSSIIWVTIGDEIEGMKVTGISEDELILQDNENSYQILLFDSEKPKQYASAQVESQPTIVTSKSPEKTIETQKVDIEADALPKEKTLKNPFILPGIPYKK